MCFKMRKLEKQLKLISKHSVHKSSNKRLAPNDNHFLKFLETNYYKYIHNSLSKFDIIRKKFQMKLCILKYSLFKQQQKKVDLKDFNGLSKNSYMHVFESYESKRICIYTYNSKECISMKLKGNLKRIKYTFLKYVSYIL